MWEGQHYRVAGLNLLAAIIIYWNTLKLGEAVFARREAGIEIPPGSASSPSMSQTFVCDTR